MRRWYCIKKEPLLVLRSRSQIPQRLDIYSTEGIQAPAKRGKFICTLRYGRLIFYFESGGNTSLELDVTYPPYLCNPISPSSLGTVNIIVM